MKRTIFRIVKVTAFMLIFCVLFSYATFVLRNKNEANIVLPFYDEPKNSLDVVFIGSSHMMCSIYPMELYDRYGIASYVFASSAQLLPQSYYQLKEALRYQSPKVVVVDVSGIIYDTKISSNEYAHVQIDNMSFSPIKYQAIFDLFDKSEMSEYIFNIIRFHSRWKEVTSEDYKKITSLTKGAYISTDCTPAEPNPEYPTDYKMEIYPTAEEYLRKIIELCIDNEITPLLFNSPALEEANSIPRCNSVKDLAAEYNIDFIDLNQNTELIGFDTATDYRDPYHCNAYGAMKVTSYLGNYFSENCNLPDRREDTNYSAWNDQLDMYRKQYVY
ncbi:MAG: hypothetical protein HFE30_01200 [Clostridiales bacterium]|nr:hypothetical protein [Clostridiales bacterium]